MNYLRLYLLISASVLFLSACSTTSERPISQANIPVDSLNVHYRKTLAHALYKERNYAASLTQWKILLAIKPENNEFKNRVRVMEALIRRRTKTNTSIGKKAFSKKDYATAEHAFLRALAMNPTHRAALFKLKEIKAKQVEAKQFTKTSKLKNKQRKKYGKNANVDLVKIFNTQNKTHLQNGIKLYQNKKWVQSIKELELFIKTAENDKKASKYLANANNKLSQVYESRKHYEPAIQHLEDSMKYSVQITEKQQKKLFFLKNSISDSYYIKGIKIYRKNIDQAIIFLNQAIEYNPNHFKAKNKLMRAYQIRKNLHKIEQ